MLVTVTCPFHPERYGKESGASVLLTGLPTRPRALQDWEPELVVIDATCAEKLGTQAGVSTCGWCGSQVCTPGCLNVRSVRINPFLGCVWSDCGKEDFEPKSDVLCSPAARTWLDEASAVAVETLFLLGLLRTAEDVLLSISRLFGGRLGAYALRRYVRSVL